MAPLWPKVDWPASKTRIARVRGSTYHAFLELATTSGKMLAGGWRIDDVLATTEEKSQAQPLQALPQMSKASSHSSEAVSHLPSSTCPIMRAFLPAFPCNTAIERP
jgi:hypothetical protein